MRLTRTKERKRQIRRKRLVIFALLLYIVIVIIGLLTADYNFNRVLSGEGKIGIFKIELFDEKIFLKVLGKEFIIRK
ncbi:hypothetical protein M2349_001407 [Caldanaerobacter subterraneus subsp. tengcongensis MB4]|jgi:hypothetical protein|uniref:Uncharacterized protein n=3 Tax=Caldanaerobacter subterraneus TaxID=911092 RepID=Q8RB73_CALS4|nr:hypothetical protein [Caldanaerobacter subterraneus]AAM24206.1 hypothetical protein TTE0950 [Caldanaerobacter subterraneus subsp. tengcongensis MB4]ERM93056.1 hypothetical protein O163_02015 [Caldanaerobacter subterraneus subsp. yonseiensis KB-1]MCS3916266.1 hypothetical protein [Caldanaerobacter subterraneus subsp. tengcongensis MB4]NNG65990.1 hypothetical protein [Caldanaerobacter subterraneus]